MCSVDNVTGDFIFEWDNTYMNDSVYKCFLNGKEYKPCNSPLRVPLLSENILDTNTLSVQLCDAVTGRQVGAGKVTFSYGTALQFPIPNNTIHIYYIYIYIWSHMNYLIIYLYYIILD